MKRSRYKLWIAALGLGLCSASYWGLTQALSPDQLMVRAEANYQDNDFDKAFTDWQAVRSGAPGTEAARRAQFEIAALQANVGQNFEAARTNYQQLKGQNGGTLAGFMAEFSLIDMDLAERRLTIPDYWNRLDSLIQRLGGLPLAHLSSQPSANGEQVALRIRPVAGLDPNTQYFLLGDLYSAASGVYFGNFKTTTVNGRNSYQFLCSRQELERAIRVERFNAQNWPPVDANSESCSMDSLQMAELSLQGLPPREAVWTGGPDGFAYPNPDTTAPRIDKLLPRANSRVSSQQKLGFRISDGGIQQSQLDLTSIEVTMDGQDIKANFKMDRRFYPRSKNSYLVVSAKSSRGLTLTPGSHILVIRCRDHDGNKASKNWNFVVTAQGKHDDDQGEEDDRDDDLERS